MKALLHALGVPYFLTASFATERADTVGGCRTTYSRGFQRRVPNLTQSDCAPDSAPLPNPEAEGARLAGLLVLRGLLRFVHAQHGFTRLHATIH